MQVKYAVTPKRMRRPLFCFRRNGNRFHLFKKVEILGVDTLDRLLPETNRLFKDLFN